MRPPPFDVLILLVGMNPLPVAISGVTLASPNTRILLFHTNNRAVLRYADKIKKFLISKLGRENSPDSIALANLGDSVSAVSIRNAVGYGALAHVNGARTFGFDFTAGKSTMGVHAAMALDALMPGKDDELTFCYLDADEQSIFYFSRRGGDIKDIGRTYLGLGSPDLDDATQKRLRFAVTEIVEKLHGWKIAGPNDGSKYKPFRREPILPNTAKRLMAVAGNNPDISVRLNAWTKGMRWNGQPEDLQCPRVLEAISNGIEQERDRIAWYLETIHSIVANPPELGVPGYLKRELTFIPETSECIVSEINSKQSNAVVHTFAAWVLGLCKRTERTLHFPTGLEFLGETLSADGATANRAALDAKISAGAHDGGASALTYLNSLWLEDAVHAHMRDLKANGIPVFHETLGGVNILLQDENGNAIRRPDGELLDIELDGIGVTRYELVATSCTLINNRGDQKDRLYAVTHQSARLGGDRAGALFVAPLTGDEKRSLESEMEGSIGKLDRVAIFGLEDFRNFTGALRTWLRDKLRLIQ